ncbi:hypothetical protein Poli38472_007347 [Pythium oligandrum]|uniref:FYVE-type domain-containing protein n=1 Tax=Pythium oligandrum TaxID=41045 RepID=A0A8K1CB66_PYTOL|nr:hypothetical protein Poli38472_007347 [Pythium oligandrum]|eukprot:TMW59202.1 hypothetical protein Poli38472_007347 [Pythium oligandrum]
MAGRFSSPFPPLRLSHSDERDLEHLADSIVHDAIVHYEAYLYDHNREIDPDRWKGIKQHENVRVYYERSKHSRRRRVKSTSGVGPHSFSSPSPSPSPTFGSSYSDDILYTTDEGEDEDRFSDAFASQRSDSTTSSQSSSKKLPPVLMTAGTVNGHLHDVMYGVVNPTIETMRIRSTYVEDKVVNAAVLATIREPTPAEPFRSIAIKWAVKNQSLAVRTVVKNRDMVFLESVGLKHLPRTGELIGYQLLHSVSFPQTHLLADTARGNISLCGIYRQLNDTTLDIFARGFLAPTGRIMRPLVIRSAADAMATVWKSLRCAQMKKLAHALRRRQDTTAVLEASEGPLPKLPEDRVSVGVVPAAKHVPEKNCSICTKALSRMAPLTFGRKASGWQCRLCMEMICSNCRVKEHLSSIDQEGWLHQRDIPFCIVCYTAVTKANAFDIAVDEILHNDAQLGYGYGHGMEGSLTSSMSSFTFSDADDFFVPGN